MSSRLIRVAFLYSSAIFNVSFMLTLTCRGTIWEYAGMFKTDKTMTIEEMDEAAMEAAAVEHC